MPILTLLSLLQQQFTQLSHAVAKASYFHQQEDQGIDMTQVRPQFNFEIYGPVYLCVALIYLMRLRQFVRTVKIWTVKKKKYSKPARFACLVSKFGSRYNSTCVYLNKSVVQMKPFSRLPTLNFSSTRTAMVIAGGAVNFYDHVAHPLVLSAHTIIISAARKHGTIIIFNACGCGKVGH